MVTSYSLHVHEDGIGILGCLPKYVSSKILLALYSILVLPDLTYVCIAWGCTYLKHIKKVYLAIKVLRIIDSVEHNQHTDEVFKTYIILTVFELIQCYSSIFLHTFQNTLLQCVSNDNFCLNACIHNHDTCQLNKLRVTYFSLTTSQHFIFCIICNPATIHHNVTKCTPF